MRNTEKFRDPKYVPETVGEFVYREIWLWYQNIKPFECEVCKRSYWLGRRAFECCQKQLRSNPSLYRGVRTGRPTERNCPRCNGEPGHYACPYCEGRGKTFLP